MGQIAQYAILNGAKVPIQELGNQLPPQHEYSQDRMLYEATGRKALVDRVKDGHVLSRQDIQFLIQDAPLPVLMKLVSLKRNLQQGSRPRPVVAFPIPIRELSPSSLGLLRERTIRYLEELRLEDIQIFFEGVHPLQIDGDLRKFFREIVQSKPGAVLIGPSIEGILQSLIGVSGSKRTEIPEAAFEESLERLSDAGFSRLRASNNSDMLDGMARVGFPNVLRLNIDEYGSTERLAERIAAIQELTQDQSLIQAWSPSFGSSNIRMRYSQPVIDLTLLRVLSVGAICFSNISIHRVSSIHMSLRAIELSPLFGANDFGFGAVDGQTRTRLGLNSFDELVRVCNGSERWWR